MSKICFRWLRQRKRSARTEAVAKPGFSGIGPKPFNVLGFLVSSVYGPSRARSASLLGPFAPPIVAPLATPIAALAAIYLLSACSPGPRPYYMRSRGAYYDPQAIPPSPVTGLSETKTAASTPSGSNKKPSKPPAPSSTPPASSKSRASKLEAVAKGYLGVPYRFGGQSRQGMDCSGFIRQVFEQAHSITLPHNSQLMFHMGTEVEFKDLQVGDVVFFKKFLWINHSGIYMGNGTMIHASSTLGISYVHLDHAYFKPKYAGARRYLGN